MWTRAELKDNAKKVLSKYYWYAFLACLIAGFLGGTTVNLRGSSSGASFNFGSVRNSEEFKQIQSVSDLDQTDINTIIGIFALILIVYFSIILIALVISTVFKIFISNPIQCGFLYYLQNLRLDDNNIGYIFSSFSGGRYSKVMKKMFFMWLYESLWSLLFIIPGIIKHYSYYLIPYIVAENPDLDKDRVFEISMSVMNGNRWKAFVLELSFIGWELLAMIPCGLGLPFLVPYIETTKVEFYQKMKEIAISEGKISEGELANSPLSI